MSKAILILDEMPKQCNICPLFEKYCDVDKDFSLTGFKRAGGCPLKPLPQKEDDLRYLDSYAKGFNDCIDEILGEEE